MTDFFTSDLHFFHDKNVDRNIVAFSDRKIVTTREEHTEWLVNLWNSQVGHMDTVFHLGDFAFAHKPEKIIELLERLNGRKVFVRGNHCSTKAWDWINENKKSLNDVARVEKWIYRHFNVGEEKRGVHMTHFPYAVWWDQQHGSYCLHGHSHGSYVGQGRILDVGLDSAFNIFGKHKFFTWPEIVALLEHKEVHLSDYHGQAD